eukprot:2094922-Heterocapsa_arctica.AAC.1
MIRRTFLAQNCVAHPMVSARALHDSFETPETPNNDVEIAFGDWLYASVSWSHLSPVVAAVVVAAVV